MISKEKLKTWYENEYNICLVGKHGVGKTAIIEELFNELGINWLYFSAPTMDPWVDFVGVPRETQDEKGVSYLDFVRPKLLAEDQVHAIFIDEFNRAPKKVRNAVMELLRYKSINGKKFENLKVIWTAINPEDDSEEGDGEYDVEKLDPAQKDRFHITLEIPYKPDPGYFGKKYPEHSDAAIEWWNGLSTKLKDNITPRRLDYVLDAYTKNIDIKDVIPFKEANVSKLVSRLKSGPVFKKLNSLLKKPSKEIKETLADENFFDAVKDEIVSKKYMPVLLPNLEQEKLALIVSKHKQALNFVTKDPQKYRSMLESLKTANLNKEMLKKITKSLNDIHLIAATKELENTSLHCVLTNYDREYSRKFGSWYSYMNYNTTQHRSQLIKEMRSALNNKSEYGKISQESWNYVLNVILDVVSRTQVGTIKNNKYFFSQIKDIIEILENDFNVDCSIFYKQDKDKLKALKVNTNAVLSGNK